MQKFEDSEQAKQAIRDLVGVAKLYEETNMTADERAVKEQRTLFYKFWCGVVYGHLYKNGICLRCKKAKTQ